MTKEDKDLLLNDLCARLRYRIICDDGYGNTLELNGIDNPNTATFKCSDKTFWTTDLDKCKPYLFPLSSMTEEQKAEFDARTFEIMFGEIMCKKDNEMGYGKLMAFDLNFYNKYHLDWRGLIPLGLAIDATGKNIY